MLRKLIVPVWALALAAAGAASVYQITVSDPTWVGARELKPGDYRVEIQGDKAVMKLGNGKIQV